MKVTRYEDLMEREHTALMMESAALVLEEQRKARESKRSNAKRSEADRLAEHSATLWATSLNMLDVRANPFE